MGFLLLTLSGCSKPSPETSTVSAATDWSCLRTSFCSSSLTLECERLCDLQGPIFVLLNPEALGVVSDDFCRGTVMIGLVPPCGKARRTFAASISVKELDVQVEGWREVDARALHSDGATSTSILLLRGQPSWRCLITGLLSWSFPSIGGLMLRRV